MKHVAIVSDLSSQGAVEPLALQLKVAARNGTNLAGLAFDTHHHNAREALAARPAALMVVLGAPNSKYQAKLNGLLADWKNTPKRSRPALILLSSDHAKTSAAASEWLANNDMTGELAPAIRIFSEGLSSIAKLTPLLEESLQAQEQNAGLGFTSATTSFSPVTHRRGPLVDATAERAKYELAQ